MARTNLMGVSYEEMFELEYAVDAYTDLVQQYPDSDFAQESWLRIGEYHFELAEFEEARMAYLRALDYGESRWYDKILFKLGWSNYLLGDYHDAIGNFQGLLAFYDDQGDNSSNALEEEALQYFAISVAEEDWDLDGLVDPPFVMGRVDQYLGEDEAWTLEVLDRLAEILMENQRYEYALEVYRHILERFPLDRRNPERHEQILVALTRLGLTEEMIEEQRTLADLYGRGSEWYAEQERLGNLEAMAYADQLARDGLFDTAARYYNEGYTMLQQANATGDATLRRQAVDSMRVASRLYRQFLEEYPYDPEVYTTRLYYAQSLYFSGEYLDAAEQFGLVRDSQESTELRETAAYFAVYTHELELERQINDGDLEPMAWPAYRGPMEQEEEPPADTEEIEDEDEENSDRTEPAEPPRQQPIPDVSLSWVGAVDRYVQLGLNREDDPTTQGRFAYSAARLFYDYGHFDDARRALHPGHGRVLRSGRRRLRRGLHDRDLPARRGLHEHGVLGG